MNNTNKDSIKNAIFTIVLPYLGVGIVYVYCSDYLLHLFVNDVDVYVRIQTFKGIAFVLITAVLLLLLVRKNVRALTAGFMEMMQHERKYIELIQRNDTTISDINNELLAANQRLQSASNIARLGYWIDHLDSGLIEWSDELYRIFGLERGSFTPTRSGIRERVHPADRYRLSHDTERLFRENSIIEREIRIVTYLGEVRWILERLRLERDADNNPVYIEGIAVDISRRKWDEQAIVRKNAFISAINVFTSSMLRNNDWLYSLEKAMEIIHDQISVERILYFENGTDEETGYRYASLMYKWVRHVTEYIDYSTLHKAPFSMSPDAVEVLATGAPFESVVRNLPDGRFKDMLVKANVKAILMLPVIVNGDFHGFVSFHDCQNDCSRSADEKFVFESMVASLGTVVEKRHAEQAASNHLQHLLESNERFKLVMKATVEAIVDWDIITDRLVWGDGFRDLFGYDINAQGNYLWTANIHPDDKEQVISTLRDVIHDKSQQYFYAEFRFLKANREIAYVQHRAIFLRDADGNAVRGIGAMIDITDTMRRISEIEQHNEVLREIAWVQSHVVRAPLASLMGLVDILRNKDEMNINEAEVIADILTAAGKLDDVIHDIVRRSEAINLHTREQVHKGTWCP